MIAANDNWDGDTQVAAAAGATGAFAFPSATSKDAALYRSDLEAGAFTAQLGSADQNGGVALAEIYDTRSPASFTASTPRLVNVSARTTVGAASDTLIAGFVIAGSSPKTVLVRAIGPTLAGFGVTSPLADPKLELYSGPTKIFENDDWAGAAALAEVAARVGAFALPAPSKDAALVMTLPPGPYTAFVSSATSAPGIALVEVYEVP